MDYYTNDECAVVFKLFPLRATVTATKVGFSGGFQSLLISKDLTQESNQGVLSKKGDVLVL